MALGSGLRRIREDQSLPKINRELVTRPRRRKSLNDFEFRDAVQLGGGLHIDHSVRTFRTAHQVDIRLDRRVLDIGLTAVLNALLQRNTRAIQAALGSVL